MARSTKERMATKRAKQRRRNQVIMLAVVAVVAGLVAVGLIVVNNRPEREDNSDIYASLPQSIDESGTGLGIGDPNAPITLVDYSDFSCPHCYDLSPAISQVVADYAASGDVYVVFKPVAFVNPPYSVPAAAASICAAEQGIFWEMHEQIWSIYERNGPQGYNDALLSQRAAQIGIDMGEFEACYNSDETLQTVQSVIDEAVASGVTGTPTVFINGERVTFTTAQTFEETLSRAIEDALAQAE